MSSGIAIVGFVPRHSVPERGCPPLPIAFAHQSVEQLGCFIGREEMLVIVEFGTRDRDQVHFFTPFIYPRMKFFAKRTDPELGSELCRFSGRRANRRCRKDTCNPLG